MHVIQVIRLAIATVCVNQVFYWCFLVLLHLVCELKFLAPDVI